MSRVVVVNKLPSFSRSAKNVLDTAMRSAASDGLINAKRNAPFDKGGLRANSETERLTPLHWRISFWEEYARFQEFGGDSKRRVRNYSTAGTGKHFLKDAGDEQANKIVAKFKTHGKRARA